MIFNVSDYIAQGDQFITGLTALRDRLVDEIGPQNDNSQSPWGISGAGWWLEATLLRGTTKWELYIQDDNLALMFKLKWL
jgi:hypothetical protein